MAKRFTETNKWTNNKWFYDLSIESKLFWIYLLDSCDTVGVWEENVSLASKIIGYEYPLDTLLKDFKKQIYVFAEGRKWWIKDFCDFQYGELNENSDSKPIKSYISLLKKHSLWKHYPKGIHTLQEKEKEKDKDKDKYKDKDKDKEKEEEKEKEIFDQARKIYPSTKRGNETEYSNFKKKYTDYKKVVGLLLPAINNQIKFRNKLHNRGQFVPQWKNFQTWINQRCWEDEMSEQIYKKIYTSEGRPRTQSEIRKDLGNRSHQFLGMEENEISDFG